MNKRLADLVAARSGCPIETISGIASDYGFQETSLKSGRLSFCLPEKPDDIVTVNSHGRTVQRGMAEEFMAFVLKRSPDAQEECRKILTRTDRTALKKMEALVSSKTLGLGGVAGHSK